MFDVDTVVYVWLVVGIHCICKVRDGNETTIAERVSHFALATQGFLPKCVRGVTFKGSDIDERHDWRWTPTTNQDVNDSTPHE
jgi:hypothetical protein